MHRKIPSRFSPEMFFVWCLTDQRFRQIYDFRCTNVDFDQFDWKKMVAYAGRSRTLLYKFSQEALQIGKDHVDDTTLHIIESVIKRGNQNLKRLLKTLIVIKNLWDGQLEYYVIKTRDDRPTGDADALFIDKTDYESAISLARRAGYRFIREEPFKGWIDVNGGVKIELHHGVSWFGMKALDKDFVASNPRKVKLMNFVFPTINMEAELALELVHWIIDIQGLGPANFSSLVSIVEGDHAWKEILYQAKKYCWSSHLTYHLSVLNELCEYIYSYKFELPLKLPKVKIRPSFPFWTPMHIKIPFLVRKIFQDNNGFIKKSNMLQLALRRYMWTRMWQ